MLDYGFAINTYVVIVTFLFGLVMGSFINCWAWRSVNGESVLHGRSHCPACGHVLGVRDLIPVLSWLASRGRCRYCNAKVSARYPITELVCAGVFTAIVIKYGLTFQALELVVFAGILLFLSLPDLDSYIIPNGCIVAALVVRIAFMAVSCALGSMDFGKVAYYVLSALGVGIALVCIVLIADKVFGRESMGGGDLKLYFVAALYFGWQQCIFLVIVSCIIGILVAVFSSKRFRGQSSGQPDQLPAGKTVGEVVEETAGQSPAGKTVGTVGEADADPEQNNGGIMTRVIPFGPSIAAACVITMLVGLN